MASISITDNSASKNNVKLLLLQKMFLLLLLFFLLISKCTSTKSIAPETEPKPKVWPEQFHSLLVMNNSKTNAAQVVDLWYDWPNGRNLNLIQNQLGTLLYDVEWTNGTSYYYTLHPDAPECRTMHFDVGILGPGWLEGATYLGQRYMNGFLCNVWTKVDFIWYYEDVITQRPVYWLFFTGMEAHVITFEVGAVLEDSKWQAPSYCFNKETTAGGNIQHLRAVALPRDLPSPRLSLYDI